MTYRVNITAITLVKKAKGFHTFTGMNFNLKLFLQILVSWYFSTCYVAIGQAQQYAAIQGTVVDHSTGKPLPMANIVLLQSNFGAAADSNGMFLIKHIPAGTFILQASRIGYAPQQLEIRLQPGERKTVNFKLSPRILEFDRITIEADRFDQKYQAEVARIGVQQIQARQLTRIPGGFDDVLRTVHIFSNTLPASDYTGFFTVRGGNPDQNLVVMDGVVIPNPYRFRIIMGGGMSIFDPNTTEDVRLHVGGFSADYGNFLSSVLEVDTRQGSRDRFGFGGSFNVMDVSTFVAGPFGSSKGSFLLAGRRSFYHLVADRFARTNATYPVTSDLNAHLVYDLTPKDQLTFRAMASQESSALASEELTEQVKIDENSKIRLFSLSWRRFVTDRLQSRKKLSYYQERFNFRLFNPQKLLEEKEYANLESRVKNLTFSEEMLHQIGRNHWLTEGIYLSFYQTRMDYTISERTLAFVRREMPPNFNFNRKELYLAGYLDGIFEITRQIQARPGLRYDYSNLTETGNFSPRFSLWVKLNEQTTVQGFWGICHQYPNVLSVFNRDLPLNFSANFQQLKAETATHYTLGLTRKFRPDISTKLEFYYKDLDRLLLPENDVTYLPRNNGIGVSKGIELFLEKKPAAAGRISGIISYSYCISRYKDDINNRWQPFNFDRRHGFSVLGKIQILANLECSLLWRIASGLPYHPVSGLIHAEDYTQKEFVLDKANPRCFPSYQRLDFRLTYQHRSGAGAFAMYFDLINVYNHKNIYDQVWQISSVDYRTSPLEQINMRTIYMLPFLPSIGVSFEF